MGFAAINQYFHKHLVLIYLFSRLVRQVLAAEVTITAHHHPLPDNRRRLRQPAVTSARLVPATTVPPPAAVIRRVSQHRPRRLAVMLVRRARVGIIMGEVHVEDCCK